MVTRRTPPAPVSVGAARHTVRPSVPEGLGLASDSARRRMVEGLRAIGIRDADVLAAMEQVPRHQFVEPGLASRAYEDVALPIGHGQTISRPSTVARMLEMAVASVPRGQRRTAKALEVGTGCGYQAAVLAALFGEVVSIERVRGLHETARTNLRPLRLPNLRLAFGDGAGPSARTGGAAGRAGAAPRGTRVARFLATHRARLGTLRAASGGNRLSVGGRARRPSPQTRRGRACIDDGPTPHATTHH